jgi:hypothetical protein
MGRIGSFLCGTVVGAVTVFGALKYHVVRANDGVHFVPKVTSGFEDTYVDIRQFGFSDWNRHRSLAMALVKSDRAELMDETAALQIRQSVEAWLQGFYGDRS